MEGDGFEGRLAVLEDGGVGGEVVRAWEGERGLGHYGGEGNRAEIR